MTAARAFAALAFAAATAAAAQGLAAQRSAEAGQGAQLFAERCKDCHESGDERVPQVAHLRTLDAPHIITVLTVGPMQPMAAGLSKDQLAAIAAYLTSAQKH